MPKVKITKAPTGSQADYGLVRKNTVTQSGDSDRKVKNTMTALKGEEKAKANIEVEGGETVLGDVNRDGYAELFEFKGKRHAQGGMDVDIPEGSFIFSDTKKLKIKDKEMLKQYFGLSSKRGGYTPAEISKKFQINEFIDTLKNPESDEMAKRSANEMVKNNMQKLGLLAFVQESIKGFPDGVPDIAQMALQELGVDANQMLQEVAPQQQGQMPPQQEMMNQEQMPMAMYGKQVKYPDGGDLPTGNQNKQNFDKYYHHLYDRLNKVYGQDFLKSKPPGVDQGAYDLISNLLVWQDDRVIPNDPKMGQMVAAIKNAKMLPDDEIKTILSYNISEPLGMGDKFSLWRKLSGDTVDRFEDFKGYVKGARAQGYTFQDGGTPNPLMRFISDAAVADDIGRMAPNTMIANEHLSDSSNERNREAYMEAELKRRLFEEQMLYNQTLENEKWKRDNPGLETYVDENGNTMVYNKADVDTYLTRNARKDSSSPFKSDSTSFDPVEGFKRDGGSLRRAQHGGPYLTDYDMDRIASRQNALIYSPRQVHYLKSIGKDKPWISMVPGPDGEEVGVTFPTNERLEQVFTAGYPSPFLGYSTNETGDIMNKKPLPGWNKERGGMIHPLSKFVGGGQLPQYQNAGAVKAKVGDVYYINNEPYKVTKRSKDFWGGEYIYFDKPLKGFIRNSYYGTEGDDNVSDINYIAADDFDRMVSSASSDDNTFQMGYDVGNFGYSSRWAPVDELSYWDKANMFEMMSDASLIGSLRNRGEGNASTLWTVTDHKINNADFNRQGMRSDVKKVKLKTTDEKAISQGAVTFEIPTEYVTPGYEMKIGNKTYQVADDPFVYNPRGDDNAESQGRAIKLIQTEDPDATIGSFFDTYGGELTVDLDDYMKNWVEDGQGSSSYVNPKGKSSGEYVQIGNKSYYRTEGTTDSFYWYNGDVKVTLSDPATVKKVKEAFAEKDKTTVKGNTASSTTTKKTSPTTTTRVNPSKKRGPITITYD